MPVYEYHCSGCDKTFEKIVNQQQEVMPCPVCGEQAKRKVSAFAATGLSCAAPGNPGFG